MASTAPMLGIISDTHDLLRPEAVAILEECTHIVHAGDICTAGLLRQLEAIAPVTAVRGNNDHDEGLASLPETTSFSWEGLEIVVIHDRKGLTEFPRGSRVIISGHSHKPSIEEKDGVLLVNPGSAGRRRFKLPVSMARMRVVDGRPEAEIVTLVGA